MTQFLQELVKDAVRTGAGKGHGSYRSWQRTLFLQELAKDTVLTGADKGQGSYKIC